MAHRGETIDFFVKGDESYDLSKIDFNVLIYPHDKVDKSIVIAKEDMTLNEDGRYSGSISYEQTKNMELGLYDVEILLIEDASSRSIFTRKSVFSMKDSASKSIE